MAVVGPSGCGKSTLLKILAGILPSTAGRRGCGAPPSRGRARTSGWSSRPPSSFRGGACSTTCCSPIDVQGLEARGPPAGRPGSAQPRGAAGLRGALSVGAVGRHAAARGHHAGPRARSRPPPHGRALRRARRHDAGAHERRAPAYLDGKEEDGALHHSLHPRGGVSRRSRARHDLAAGEDPGGRAGEERATAKPRHHEHARVRRARAAHPRPLQREGRIDA